MNDNLFWLLLGVALGSSLIMGTQFVKAYVDSIMHAKEMKKLREYVNSTREQL